MARLAVRFVAKSVARLAAVVVVVARVVVVAVES